MVGVDWPIKALSMHIQKLYKGINAGDIFFYGWLVRTVFKLYGSLVFDQRKQPFLFMPNRQNSDVFPSNIGKKQYPNNSPIVASVAVITILGKHVFSEEFIQGNNALG